MCSWWQPLATCMTPDCGEYGDTFALHRHIRPSRSLSPCVLFVHFCTVLPHTAFKIGTAKAKAIVLRVIKAHSKNCDFYQQQHSQIMCQSKGKICNRRHILGRLLERGVFSFFSIYWIAELLYKAQISYISWNKPSRNCLKTTLKRESEF